MINVTGGSSLLLNLHKTLLTHVNAVVFKKPVNPKEVSERGIFCGYEFVVVVGSLWVRVLVWVLVWVWTWLRVSAFA